MHQSACLIYDLRKFEQRGNEDRYTAAAAAAPQINLKDYATMRGAGGYATTGGGGGVGGGVRTYPRPCNFMGAPGFYC